MNELIIYLIGWLALSLGYYIYKVYINQDRDHKSKKYYAYQAFKIGIFSWGGIIFFIAFAIVFVIVALDVWIEDLLS